MRKPILLVKSLIAAGVLFVSCDNSSDDIQCPEAISGELSATETTFTGTWTLQSIVAEDEIDLTDDDTDNPSTDIYGQFTDCEKDLVYEFGNDRSYTYSLGKTATGCNNENEVSGTWELSETGTLRFVGNCTSQALAIDVNDENTAFTFEGTYNFTDVNGTTISTKTSFTYAKSE
ncbi:DUF5004 domain-containing protein [Tamlana crocina]